MSKANQQERFQNRRGRQWRQRVRYGPSSPLLILTAVAAMMPFAANATTYNCTTFSIPGGQVQTTGINNANIAVGTYSSSGRSRGFIREADGSVRFVDYPGADGTQLFTINNKGVITGFWSGSSQRGYFTVDLQGNFKPVIFPPPYDQYLYGISIYGINDDGVLAGAAEGPNGGFFILKPDATLNLVPGSIGGAPTMPPVSLNNSLQLLELHSDGVFLTTQLLGSDGTLTPIVWNYPDPNTFNAGAYGLNNLGTVVGFTSWYYSGGSPYAAFERDPSGVYSEVVCPGVAVSGLLPAAINDKGVIAGGPFALTSSGFVATPQPGTAHLTFSASSVAFPAEPAAPVSVTITNTGDARLDIGNIRMYGNPGFGQPVFSVSGCLDPVSRTTSLDPGASCVLSVSVPPPGSPGRRSFIADLLIIDDSSPGAPHSIPVTAEGPPPPAPFCRISNTAPGPPTELTFTMYDMSARLSSVLLLDSLNAAANIPSFMPGWVGPLYPTVTQVNPSKVSRVNFQVTNMAGISTTCGATFGGPTQWTGIGGTLPSKTAVARNSDGRLQAFTRGVHNGLWTVAQIEPDGDWSAWQNLGGVINSDPAVGVNADGRLEVFALGSDNSLWHIWQTSPNGGWSDWEGLGGILISNPTVATNSDGRLEVFALGTDRALWHIWQTYPNGTWSDWDYLGGVITGNPAVAVNSDGRLEVFVYGTDSSLWHILQAWPGGRWSDWAGLGGSFAGDPVAILRLNGRLEVFGRGTDTQLWHIAQTTAGGAWSNWNSLGGVITSDPALVSNADGRLEAFARGADNALWHITEAAPGDYWRAWASLGGVLADGVAAAENLDGRVTVLAAGSDQSLWVLEQVAPGFWN